MSHSGFLRGVLALVGLIACISNASAQSDPAPAKAPHSISYYRFAEDTPPLHAVDFVQSVLIDPGVQANVFWSNQFRFEGAAVAYTGLQSTGGNPRQFIFSVWNTKEAKPGSPGSHCLAFDNEGSGMSCRIDFEWKAGLSYRFHVESQGDGWFSVQVTELSTGTTFTIGSIRTTSDAISANEMMSFTEYFEPGPYDSPCFSQPYSKAQFELPVGDGAYRASISSTLTGPDCTDQSRVSETVTGSTHINGIGNSRRGMVEDRDHHCLEANDLSVDAGPCMSTDKRAWVWGGDGALRLQSNSCLSATPDGTVTASGCNGSQNQHWTYDTTTLRNEATSKCLTSPEGGGALTVVACGVGGQSWHLPVAIPPPAPVVVTPAAEPEHH